MTKIICYFLLIWGIVYSLNTQEGVVTNYFLPSRMDTRGEVDSLFQVNYNIYENESTPTYYKNYVFDGNGHVISMMRQSHGAYSSIYVTTLYHSDKIVEEVVSLPYVEEDTNTFAYNAAGKVVEIRNKESFIHIRYDDQERIIQIDHAYSDGFVFEGKKYNYTSPTVYSVVELVEGNVYATAEYENGKCIRNTKKNGLETGEITNYRYNEKGDLEEMKVLGLENNQYIIKTNYEYDDRGNWIKCTERNYRSGEKPYSDGYATRKIIYKDGHVTGYDVTY